MESKRKRIYPEKLTEKTLDGVAELEKLCFSQPWSKNSLELLTKEGIGMGMVCRKDGIVCAYGGMLVAVDEGQITNIATHPDFRRRGCASAVIDALEEFLSSKGVDSIFLEVRVSNTPARSLYERKGFRTVGVRKNYYRFPTEDAAVMLKTFD